MEQRPYEDGCCLSTGLNGFRLGLFIRQGEAAFFVFVLNLQNKYFFYYPKRILLDPFFKGPLAQTSF